MTTQKQRRPMSFVHKGLLVVALATAPFTSYAANPPSAKARVIAVSDERCERFHTHGVIHDGAPVPCARLRIVEFAHYDFDGEVRKGELVVIDAIAENVRQLAEELYRKRFPITKAVSIDAYDGDDDRSGKDDNTSAFNHRMTYRSPTISLHSYGAAIDINPSRNPYITLEKDGKITVEYPASRAHMNRARVRPGKPNRLGYAEDVVDDFARHGFTSWGGDDDNPVNYQHFQLPRTLGVKLSEKAPSEARAFFGAFLAQYKACRAKSRGAPDEARARCVVQSDAWLAGQH
jgi:hypothetical protein